MFNLPSINDVYRAQLPKVQDSIRITPDSKIINSPTEELVEELLISNSYDRIEKDPNREMTVTKTNEIRDIPARMREDAFYRALGNTTFEYETVTVTIPIMANSNMSDFQRLRTSTVSLSWSPKDWHISSTEIKLRIDVKGYGFDHTADEDRLAKLIQDEIGRVEQWISWVNGDIDKENESLKKSLRAFIEERKHKLETDNSKLNSLVKKLNITLEPKADTTANNIRLNPKPLVKRIKPTPGGSENFVLDQEKVLDVVSIIDNQGRQFEKTPKSYASSGEEDLRNVILVGLNGVFEGSATGETFSNNGKTDIHLNIDRGNILVAECKIWNGKKLYLETIDQLLGYLTWRHNFGILITFVRQKTLTKILEEIQEIIASHPSFNTGVTVKTSTHLISRHRLPQDEGKDVEIHHLFYHLPD